MSLFTRDELPPALRRYVPPGATLTYPNQGMTSEVALVESERPCVIKRCRDPIYLEWLIREQFVLRALDGSRLPIPHVIDYTEVDIGDRREAWLVMTRLHGRPLWHNLLRADATERSDLLRRVGVVETAAPDTGASRPGSGCARIDRMLAKARANLAWCDGTTELLADLHRRRPPIRDVLIHGDLALDNLLIATDGSTSLIDWPSGDSGDPRCDVSLALQTEPEIQLSETELDAFFASYGTAPLDRITRRWFEDLYEFF